MKKQVLVVMFWFAVLLVTNYAAADLIFFENFENSSGFTLSGNYQQDWEYWGIAPLSGTDLVPSGFIQGGGQSGNIFFGSYAWGKIDGLARPLMTIHMPEFSNLSEYSAFELTVALAAPDGDQWQVGLPATHDRDLFFISTGGYGSGLIDLFRPISDGTPMQSQVYSEDLHPEFQDFSYTLESMPSTICFAFSSFASDEYIGIDSVRISGIPKESIVPEPTTLILLGLGLAGIAFKRKMLP